jgi:short-subunit dehydrogenase
MTRAFLPALERRPQAQVVNLSSLFGLIAPPGQSAYAAAKFAVRGFSEALRHELEAAGSPVGVSVVHPGGVRTGIAANARAAAAVGAAEAARHQAHFQKVLRLDADQAGEIIVRGIEKRQPRILVGQDAKLVAVIERLMPVGYWRIIGRGRG